MPSTHSIRLVALLAIALSAGCVGIPGSTSAEQSPTTDATATCQTPDDNATVQLCDRNGTALGSVEVDIAATNQERYTGLSETESLAADEGMLFVYEREGTHDYVMRNMSFPLDIVFVAANGTITRIHHAETEPNVSGADLTRYRGTGQYVLEVNRGYTNETGVEVGDTVALSDDVD
ncbi:DUF192 domain-containing protein [Halorientalis salina]|uniref:DUF192 domain-containing protein n=1 Tax=Halorientalis salina TaxID=2932266 RepID=UPI002022A079|nr:DUF192 domain-containing protein [Halorientalis salina]